jgi:hypothetical protein
LSFVVCGGARFGRPYARSATPEALAEAGTIVEGSEDTAAGDGIQHERLLVMLRRVAPTRFLVHESVYGRFMAGMVDFARSRRIGSGLEAGISLLAPCFTQEQPVDQSVGISVGCGKAFAPTH